MKRSEFLRLQDMMFGFQTSSVGSFGFDELEGRYEDGKEAAYESAADSIEDFLSGAIVDVEDVTLCSSTLVFPFPKRDWLHAVGSKPYQMLFQRETGCRACLAVSEKARADAARARIDFPALQEGNR